jgi:hypothetical protein
MEVVGVVFIAPTTIIAVGQKATPTTIIAVGQKATSFHRRAHRTVRAHRTWYCSLSSACHVSRSLEYVAVDRWIHRPPDSPVRPDLLTVSNLLIVSDPSGSRPLALCGEVDCWPWAHWTVWCTPNSPVNYSRGAFSFSRERHVRWARHPGHRTLSNAHQTVRCTTG